MILKAGPDAPPHFFLIGFRAPPGGVLADGKGERVGVLVARSVIRFDGMPGGPGEVRKEDEPHASASVQGPFRYESEIAPWKPEPDVIVVDNLAHAPATLFGSVEVDRGDGFGPATARNFDWLPRAEGARLALAGRLGDASDPVSLAGFKGDLFNLPDRFDNAFHNGGPLPGGARFAPGDRLRFKDNALVTVATVTIPTAPSLSASESGVPLDPQPVPAPLVDTVVMDLGRSEFTLVWRATFPWEPRFERAVLEVN